MIYNSETEFKGGIGLRFRGGRGVAVLNTQLWGPENTPGIYNGTWILFKGLSSKSTNVNNH
jgi:hypothetical protein